MADKSVEIIQRMNDLRGVENPIGAAIAGITAALLEFMVDEHDSHARRLRQARIDVEMNKLRTMPDDEWCRWYDGPKEEFFETFARVLSRMGG